MLHRLAARSLRPALRAHRSRMTAAVLTMSDADLQSAWQKACRGFRTSARSARAEAEAAAAPAAEEEDAVPAWDLTRQEEVPEGIIQKFQLDHWTRWVPLTLLGFGFGSASGIYHINEETQLLCVFSAFVAVVYAKGAQPMADLLDETRHGMLKEHEESEGVLIGKLEEYRDALEVNADLGGDVERMFDSFRGLEDDMAAAYSRQHKIDTRDSFVRFLDLRLAEQNEFVAGKHEGLVEQTTADVRATFSSSKELRDASLSSAMATISGGGAAGGEDPVTQLYADALGKNVNALKADLSKEVTLDAAAKAAWTEKWQERVRRVGHGLEEDAEVMNLTPPDKVSYAKLL